MNIFKFPTYKSTVRLIKDFKFQILFNLNGNSSAAFW